ncbi:MAG: hypothetical protein M3303_07240 [Gemmatimonadota bacterium]|nr:hypothetical protein [Gemmatimonadota bacterium]
MNATHRLAGLGLALASLSVLSACASSGQGASGGTTQVAAAQAGTASQRRANALVLTAAEMASIPSIMNAYDAVRMLRPNFLKTRASTRPSGLLGPGAEGQATGRRPGQVQGAPPPGAAEDGAPSTGNRALEDPGILVYLDRQRYGRVESLREIQTATIEEIRFLNVGEANSQFGMGHPHGVIQVILRRDPAPR